MRELRTDHAGEIGAVMIYRGILSVSKDLQVRAFAQHHLASEQRHLDLLSETVPVECQTLLVPVWRISGWLTGAIPALFGPRAVFATIQAVETFVDQHYASQLIMIDRMHIQWLKEKIDVQSILEKTDSLQKLRALLVECQFDEIEHREDARSRWDQDANFFLAFWLWLVTNGSQVAVGICRYI